MHYQKIYNQIINRSQHRLCEDYIEKHHIIPKCMGGNNDENNIVHLSFREHFICHWLLCKIYPNNKKLLYAFSSMVRVSITNSYRNDILTSRHFNLVKKYLRPYVGKWNAGRTPWNKGLTGTDFLEYYEIKPIPPNMSGYRWINNGHIQKKIQPSIEIPDGWVRGRLDIRGDNNPMKNSNTVMKCIQSRGEKYVQD